MYAGALCRDCYLLLQTNFVISFRVLLFAVLFTELTRFNQISHSH